MIIFKMANDLADYLQKQKTAKRIIGFIPTMGALHNGHISLIGSSKKENDITVCSIFINPTQFSNPTDFEKYPVTIEDDIDKLEKSNCDILFFPSVEEMYPTGSKLNHYDLGYLETVLEGEYRPGHYQGVCQVVDRLLSIVKPDHLYLGQKDYQQCMIIKKLIEIKKYSTRICIEGTVRESDGLAMSSRNLRLNISERAMAVKIFEALSFMKNELKKGSLVEIKQQAKAFLSANKFKVDYAEIADASNLLLLQEWDGKTRAVILIAAYLHEIRLIDNLIVDNDAS